MDAIERNLKLRREARKIVRKYHNINIRSLSNGEVEEYIAAIQDYWYSLGYINGRRVEDDRT